MRSHLTINGSETRPALLRRGDRVAYRAGLKNRKAPGPREFESPSLRLYHSGNIYAISSVKVLGGKLSIHCKKAMNDPVGGYNMTRWPTQDEVETLLGQWKAEITALQQKIDVVELVREMFQQVSPDGNSNSVSDIDIDSLKGCRNQREALKEIAQQNQGVVRVREVPSVLKAAGLSHAKPSSISSTSYNILSHSDDWEYVEPGTFRLIDYTPEKIVAIAPDPPTERPQEMSFEMSNCLSRDEQND